MIILVLRLSLFCRSGGCGVHTSSDGVTLDVEEVGALQKDLWIDSKSEILYTFCLQEGGAQYRVREAQGGESQGPRVANPSIGEVDLFLKC